MAAQDVRVGTVVLPNLKYDPAGQTQYVDKSLGFTNTYAGQVRTLSTNNPHNYPEIEGLLYVPVLPTSNPCDNATRALIPTNVTTRADFPSGDWPLVALAPWTSADCVLSYLSVMRDDGVDGALFFHPGNDSSQPPVASDPSWSLQDGGQWKSVNQYPVYAIAGMQGRFLLDEMASYNGNMSQVPYGQELAQIYNPHDYVRLYVDINISASNGIPSLWVFLIIVLAILLAVVLTTSIIMHIVQRKQRRRLQNRVANGEVDLEALGIKRLNVPQEYLDKMPQYVYTSKPEPNEATETETDKTGKPDETETATNGIPPGGVTHEVHFSQRTCPICLDDFIHGETTVRELPCNHIFHPECIDPFLRNNSSLCPMCKKSALPVGYCPVQVTNLMVRRERLIRRTRERDAPEQPAESGSGRRPGPLGALNRTVRRVSIPLPHRTNPYGSAAGGHAEGSEMHSMPPITESNVDDDMPPEVRAQGVAARRAWRREHLARQHGRDYDEQADEARALDVSRPLWRRILGRIFPNLE